MASAIGDPTGARAAAAATVAVDASDVTKLVLQWLKESGMTGAMQALVEESGISLNTVDNVDAFVADIKAGQWDRVLTQVGTLKLPPAKLTSLYEQVVRELVEMREIDTARALVRGTMPLALLKQQDPERYLALEKLLNRGHIGGAKVYPVGTSKQALRDDLARSLAEEVCVVKPSRLMALIGQALKWQQHTGQLPPSTEFDVFRGVPPKRRDAEEKVPKKKHGTIKFGKDSHADSAIFTPDGRHLITGSVDGFVEVWNPDTGKLNKELDYQAENRFMMHDDSVLCLDVSQDSDLLATASRSGKIKVWDLTTGKCVRKFLKAHEEGVTSVSFSRAGTLLLSTSFDHTARMHGLRSGKTLKQFRGHTSFVNHGTFSATGSKVITASSDGTVKVWDATSAECKKTFKLPQPTASSELPVHMTIPIPKATDQLLVCNRSSNLYITTESGEVLKTLTSGKSRGGDFLSCHISPKGKYVYCVAEDHNLYTFKLASGDLVHTMKVSEAALIGVTQHPHRNLIATWADEGKLRLWRGNSSK